jgi:hypothetical protein
MKLNFPTKFFFPFHASYMPHPSHTPWFDHANDIWRVVQSSSSCNFYFLSLKREYPPSAPCSQTRTARDQPSHRYKTAGRNRMVASIAGTWSAVDFPVDVLSLTNIWTVPYFHRIHYLCWCDDSGLHCGHEVSTSTWFPLCTSRQASFLPSFLPSVSSLS